MPGLWKSPLRGSYSGCAVICYLKFYLFYLKKIKRHASFKLIPRHYMGKEVVAHWVDMPNVISVHPKVLKVMVKAGLSLGSSWHI